MYPRGVAQLTHTIHIYLHEHTHIPHHRGSLYWPSTDTITVQNWVLLPQVSHCLWHCRQPERKMTELKYTNTVPIHKIVFVIWILRPFNPISLGYNFGLSECSRVKMDGRVTCDFTSFSTVFQSYQEDGRLIMKGCVQWNPIYELRRLHPEQGLNSGPLDR